MRKGQWNHSAWSRLAIITRPKLKPLTCRWIMFSSSDRSDA